MKLSAIFCEGNYQVDVEKNDNPESNFSNTAFNIKFSRENEVTMTVEMSEWLRISKYISNAMEFIEKNENIEY
jgi:hypothetical protein